MMLFLLLVFESRLIYNPGLHSQVTLGLPLKVSIYDNISGKIQHPLTP